MEDLLKEPILEQLFKARKEKFEYYIVNTDEEYKQDTEKIIKVQDDIKEQLKKAIGDGKAIKEIKEKFTELEIAMSAEIYDWSINYYKLGFYDGINFRKLLREYKQKEDKKAEQESFLYRYMEYFIDFIEEGKTARLKEREDYQKALLEIEEIKEKYPKVREFLEDDKISDFNKEENGAILKIIKLNNDATSIEVEEVFKLGIKEGTLL